MAGCSSEESSDDTSVAEGAATSGKRLALDGEWESIAGPDGTNVEDFAVAKIIPDTRPAYIFMLSRKPWSQNNGGSTRSEVVVSRSADGGKTFKKLSVIPSAPAHARITVAPSDDRIVFVTAGGMSSGMSEFDAKGQLWISEDGGETFSPNNVPGHLDGVPETPVVLDVNPENPSHLVGAMCDGLYRSLNRGLTFERVAGSPNMRVSHGCNYAELHRGANDRDTMYIEYSIGEGGGTIVKRSTNGGGTWEDVADLSMAVSGFEVHPKDAKRLYAFDMMKGWISSADNGRSWNPHNRSLALDEQQAGPHTVFSSVKLSNVAFDTFTGAAELPLYIVNDGKVKRWSPANAPEGGSWVDAFPAPRSGMRQIEIANTWVSLQAEGGPSPILIGLDGDWNATKLAIARLKIVTR